MSDKNAQPLLNSMAVMLTASIRLTIFLFIIEKIVANNAPMMPRIIPKIYSTFTALTTKYIPGMIKSPRAISYLLNLAFVIIGSNKDVKNVVVEKEIKAIDTLEYLIEPKKQTQCTATKTPINAKCRMNFKSFTFFIAFKIMGKKSKKLKEVKNIRHQTSGNSSNEINFPKIPVNPNKKTVKCNSKYAFLVSSIFIKVPSRSRRDVLFFESHSGESFYFNRAKII